MKYPKKHRGIKEPIKMPIKLGVYWYPCLLFKDKSFIRKSIAYYENEDSCWIPCKARNKRIGYSKKDVSKIIKKYYDAKKSKERKK